MSGRGDVYRFEPPRLFRGLSGVCRDIQSAFNAREVLSLFALKQSIPTLVPGDPNFARDLYRGRLKLANKLLEGELDRLLSSGKNPNVTDALHSLSWLPHLAAADLSLYRGFSRNLYKLCSQQRGLPAIILCQRLMMLCRHADFLLAGATSSFSRQFFSKVSREIRTLKAARMRTIHEELRQALALLAVSIAFKGAEGLRNQALEMAAAAIPGVIVADGGHVSRNPQLLLELLLDLIPLHDVLRDSRVSIPTSLGAAINRAYPMLRMMCHPDGGLALFQGVANKSEAAVSAVLSTDPHQLMPLRHAMISGYSRLDRGKSALIMDVGKKGDFCGALSFEFSHGFCRIVTNCGTPEMASPAWRAAASSAAAHSGLQFCVRDWRRFPSFLSRRTGNSSNHISKTEVIESEQGQTINTAINASGLVHCRKMHLAHSGYCLEGEDRFIPLKQDQRLNGNVRFIMRFHLDPTVKAFSGRSGSSIMLMLPDRGVWQFSVGGLRPTLEESVVLAGSCGIQNSLQIVIRGTIEHTQQIAWAFRRVEKPARYVDSEEDSPALPF